MKTSRPYIPLAKPYISAKDKQNVIDALESGWITLGPKTRVFEEKLEEYTGATHAVAVSSATAGLHLALVAAGIGKGDQVIAPTFTFAATINPVIHVGATPVLVDIRKDTYNIDLDEVEKNINSKTKAIIPVHYAGQAVDMDRLYDIAKRHNLVVIEDAAHAIGSMYKKAMIGNTKHMAVFSFHPIKNITTGDGGAVVTNSKEYADNVRLNRLHGMDKEAWRRFDKSGSWYYEITSPGYKYNMTDISASLGISQLSRIEQFIKKREKIAAFYTETFSSIEEITVPAVKKNIRHAWNLYSIVLDVDQLNISRNELIEELKKFAIGASVYFMPLHLHPYYQKTFSWKKGSFPVSEWVYKRLVCIPMYPKMTMKDASYVAKSLISIVNSNKK